MCLSGLQAVAFVFGIPSPLLCLSHQVVQTIRAADLDDFANGKFSFFVPAEHQIKTNFTVKDNSGKTSVSKWLNIQYLLNTTYLLLIGSIVSRKSNDKAQMLYST